MGHGEEVGKSELTEWCEKEKTKLRDNEANKLELINGLRRKHAPQTFVLSNAETPLQNLQHRPPHLHAHPSNAK